MKPLGIAELQCGYSWEEEERGAREASCLSNFMSLGTQCPGMARDGKTVAHRRPVCPRHAAVVRAQASSSKTVTASSSGAARPADSPSSPASARYGHDPTRNSEVGMTRLSLAPCGMQEQQLHRYLCMGRATYQPGLPALTITLLLSCSQRRQSSCIADSQHLPSGCHAAERAGEWPGLDILGGSGWFPCPGELLQHLLCNPRSVGDHGAPQLGLP